MGVQWYSPAAGGRWVAAAVPCPRWLLAPGGRPVSALEDRGAGRGNGNGPRRNSGLWLRHGGCVWTALRGVRCSFGVPADRRRKPRTHTRVVEDGFGINCVGLGARARVRTHVPYVTTNVKTWSRVHLVAAVAVLRIVDKCGRAVVADRGARAPQPGEATGSPPAPGQPGEATPRGPSTTPTWRSHAAKAQVPPPGHAGPPNGPLGLHVPGPAGRAGHRGCARLASTVTAGHGSTPGARANLAQPHVTPASSSWSGAAGTVSRPAPGFGILRV